MTKATKSTGRVAMRTTMMITLMAVGLWVMLGNYSDSHADDAPSFTPSCPQSDIDSGLRPMTTTCAPCRDLVDIINAQIETIKAIEERLNKAIKAYNDECGKVLENPCATQEGNPSCNDGERVTFKMTYRGDGGGLPIKRSEDFFGSTGYGFNSADEMLQYISKNLRRPIDRNAKCRDCVGYLKILQHGHDEDARQAQIAAGKRPDASLAGTFQFGELQINDGNVDDKTGKIKPFILSDRFPEGRFLNGLKKFLCKDATIVFAQCNIAMGPKGDETGKALADFFGVNVMAPNFSTKMFACPTMDSPDAGGGTYKGFKPTEPIKDKCEEKFERDKKRLDDEKKRLAARVGVIKAELDAAIKRLDDKKSELKQCEEDKCKGPSALGKFFGEIFGGIDADKAAHDNKHSTKGGSTYVPKDCPKCKPISERLIKAQKKLEKLEPQAKEAKNKQKNAQDAYDKAKKRLDKLIDDLELGVEEGVGAESTDPTTGIKTSSYDNGRGQVEIKRFDKNGKQIGETEYRTRPSTADKRKKVEKLEKELAKLKKKLEEAEKEATRLEKELKALSEQADGLRTALNACMEKCKKALSEPPKEEPKITTGGSTPMQPRDQEWDDEFGSLIEEIERSLGRELTDEEIDHYYDNPEEMYRFLGMDGEAEPEPKPKPKKPKPKPKPKPIKPEPVVIDEDGFEIELEGANFTDGVNPFDARGIRDLHDEGVIRGPGIKERDDGHVFVPSGKDIPVEEPKIEYTVGDDKVVVEPKKPEEPKKPKEPKEPKEPKKPEPLKVSSSGSIQFSHIVGVPPEGSPCPTPAGSVSFTAASGNPLSVISTSVSGAIQPKLNVSPQGSSIRAEFNCSSPENGTFTGTITVKVKDTKTGQTADVKVNAKGSVTGG
ncbi:MAG: hypothetical protein MRY32_05980 [Rickettsiales bacterium]|nr:hypothetical protein [Rickettsiales bacterium]